MFSLVLDGRYGEATLRSLCKLSFSVLAWTFLCAVGVKADLIQVSVDTSSIAGQNGNLDFQFNPGGDSAEAGTVNVTDFQTAGGSLAQPALLTGDAVGSLPGSLTLDNGTAYNDVFQGFTYGNSFSFVLTLSGQALNNPGGTVGSSFALSLYDAAGVTPLLTTDPFGSVFTVNLDTNGIASVMIFPQSPTNNSPVVTASTVPEPSPLILLGVTVFVALLIYRAQSLPPPARQLSSFQVRFQPHLPVSSSTQSASL